MNRVVWIASYPRSGNTWLRLLIGNYLFAEGPADINAIPGSLHGNNRSRFDALTGWPSSDLPLPVMERLFPNMVRALSAGSTVPVLFVKTHCAMIRNDEGDFIFPPDVPQSAIYLVRNPLDVAVSLAAHFGCPIDQAIGMMNDPDHVLAGRVDRLRWPLPERLGTWAGHVASWTNANHFPIHVLRYEDLLADSPQAFTAALRFLRENPIAEQVAKAVDYSSFDRVQTQEDQHGFREGPPECTRFFRSGRSGEGKTRLSPDQITRIVSVNGAMMDKFGYRTA